MSNAFVDCAKWKWRIRNVEISKDLINDFKAFTNIKRLHQGKLIYILQNFAYYSKSEKIVSISFNKNNLPTEVSFKILKEVVRFLQAKKIIKHKKGYKFEGSSLNSRIIFKAPIESIAIKKRYKAKTILRMKKGDDVVDKVIRHPRTKILQRSLDILNKCKIEVEGQEIMNLSAKSIFNNNLHSGGRIFYKKVSHMPKKLREKITINGEPVIEPDFKSMHVSLLLQKEFNGVADLELFNPYECLEEYPRKFQKLLLLTAINSSDLNACVKAVFKSWNDALYSDMKKSSVYKSILRALKKNTITKEAQRELTSVLYEDMVLSRRYNLFEIKKIFNLVMKENWYLRKYLFTGMGIKLMREESDTAFKVIDQCNTICLPVICIHDSFIIPKSRLDDFKSVIGDVTNLEMDFAA